MPKPTKKSNLESMMGIMLQKMDGFDEKIKSIEERIALDPILHPPEGDDEKIPQTLGLNPLKVVKSQVYTNLSEPPTPPCPHGIQKPYGYNSPDHWCAQCDNDAGMKDHSGNGIFTKRQVYMPPANQRQ